MTPDVTTRKTVGLDPKVPAQAVATILVFLLAYFGINLDAEVSSALAVLLGFAAGYIAPAAKTTVSS